MGGSISKKVSRSWEGACTTRPCAKWLKAALPKLVDSMERRGHLTPDPAVRDRLLKPIRATDAPIDFKLLWRPIRAQSRWQRCPHRNLMDRRQR